MADPELELRVLLAEKSTTDERIRAHIQLLSTVHLVAFITVAALLTYLGSHALAIGVPLALGLLGAALVSIVASLITTMLGGWVIGLVHFKNQVLGPRLRQLLGLSYNPLTAITEINRSPARDAIVLPTKTLAQAHLLAGALSFFAAAAIVWQINGAPGPFLAVLVAVAILLGRAFVAAFRFAKAVDAIRNADPG